MGGANGAPTDSIKHEDIVNNIKEEKIKVTDKDKVKSSSEFLVELFGVFNAPPPAIKDIDTEDQQDDVSAPSSSRNKNKSKKKSKHKNKKKKTKSKKRGRSSSDDSDSENEPVKKKSKKSKHKKHKKKEKTTDSSSDKETTSPTGSEVKIKTEDTELRQLDSRLLDILEKNTLKVKSEDSKKKDNVSESVNDSKYAQLDARLLDILEKNALKVRSEDSKKKKKSISKSVNAQLESHLLDMILEKNALKVKREDSKKKKKNLLKSVNDTKDTRLLDILDKNAIKSEDSNKKKETVSESVNEVPIPENAEILTDKLPEEPVENKNDPENDKNKTGSNKIQIKNLKYSTVFEETMKQIEEKARIRAEKYEEGEISSSTDGSSDSEDTNLKNSDDVPKTSDKTRESPKRNHHDVTRKSQASKSESSSKTHSKSPQRSHSRTQHKRSRSRSPHSSRSRHRKHSRSELSDRQHSRNPHSLSRSSYSSKYHPKEDDKRHRRDDRRRSKDRDLRYDIDKKRLLEIARKNAINMIQNGSLPAALNLGAQAQQKVISAIKSGGKSIDELTDFCKTLSRKEALGELSSVSSDGDTDNENSSSRPFHHPFQVKDKPPIVMNIKGGTQLPLQSFQEKTIEQSKTLRLQFPVSSGTDHRGAESEWRPVSPPVVKRTTPSVPKQVPNPPFFKAAPKPAPTAISEFAYPTPVPTLETLPIEPEYTQKTSGLMPPPPAPVPPVLPGPQVFPSDVQQVDLGSIVSQRLTAIRRLQQNPNDPTAIDQITEVNKEISKWAQSKQEPGLFTGSTGVQILTPRELASGTQAWARPDQLQQATPVSGGMGMHLLQKMGWRPGEGLGKSKNGSLIPLLLEVKLDTKGLLAKEEAKGRNVKRGNTPTVKTLAGKHPVSLLGEFCSKRKLGVPSYSLCYEAGPDHKKNFLFKVTVNGIEYQPNVASCNKKQAKADAAQLCLQQLGLIS